VLNNSCNGFSFGVHCVEEGDRIPVLLLLLLLCSFNGSCVSQLCRYKEHWRTKYPAYVDSHSDCCITSSTTTSILAFNCITKLHFITQIYQKMTARLPMHIMQVETLTAVTVNPALVLPMPVVSTDRGDTLHAYFRNCDFPVPTQSHPQNKYQRT